MADNILPTVAELQASRTRHFDEAIRKIGADIRAKEANGARSMCYWPKVNEPIPQIVAELQKHGFNVQVKTDMDPRDGGAKFLDIGWS